VTSLLQTRLARLSIFVGGVVLASCGQAKDPSRPSILPELARMQPVFECIEATPQGSTAEIENCAKNAGISVDKLPNEPKKADDFKPLIVATWVFFDQDTTMRLRSKSLPFMIDYARCVETSVYADRTFSNRTKKGVEDARQRADISCINHPLSFMGLKPNEVTAAADVRERMIAKLMAATAVNYALEANGWYPDEMRPCIRYLDGRPPSVGCSLNPQPKMTAPPPPTGYRPQ
jgi:hypothetical protein